MTYHSKHRPSSSTGKHRNRHCDGVNRAELRASAFDALDGAADPERSCASRVRDAAKARDRAISLILDSDPDADLYPEVSSIVTLAADLILELLAPGETAGSSDEWAWRVEAATSLSAILTVVAAFTAHHGRSVPAMIEHLRATGVAFGRAALTIAEMAQMQHGANLALSIAGRAAKTTAFMFDAAAHHDRKWLIRSLN